MDESRDLPQEITSSGGIILRLTAGQVPEQQQEQGEPE
jgi:hypothetical protein